MCMAVSNSNVMVISKAKPKISYNAICIEKGGTSLTSSDSIRDICWSKELGIFCMLTSSDYVLVSSDGYR